MKWTRLSTHTRWISSIYFLLSACGDMLNYTESVLKKAIWIDLQQRCLLQTGRSKLFTVCLHICLKMFIGKKKPNYFQAPNECITQLWFPLVFLKVSLLPSLSTSWAWIILLPVLAHLQNTTSPSCSTLSLSSAGALTLVSGAVPAQWLGGGRNWDLLNVNKHLYPYFYTALWLYLRWRIGEDWNISYKSCHMYVSLQ